MGRMLLLLMAFIGASVLGTYMLMLVAIVLPVGAYYMLLVIIKAICWPVDLIKGLINRRF